MTVYFIEPEIPVATWRTGWPVKELRRRGYDAVLSARGHPVEDVRDGHDTTVVMHIPNRTWTTPDGQVLTPLHLCEIAKERARLMVSFDDDLSQLLELEIGPKPRERALELWRQIPLICRMASRVIVATPRLAEVYAKWSAEVRVVENYLPRWVIEMPRKPRKDRVAWMGHMAGKVHGRDWDMLMPWARRFPPLLLVGAERWTTETFASWGVCDVEIVPGTIDQRKLYREIGRARAAIVPLVDMPFQRGKSWIKPMEFMARGVQPFASAHREYDRLNVLTGAVPTFAEPADLVQAVAENWRSCDGEELPGRLLDTGLYMEAAGGDAWEQALA